LAHRAKSKQNRAEEDRLKRESKKRDRYTCRWPHCVCRTERYPLESAHWARHKGSGGDPKLIRTTLDGLVTLCFLRHQGAVSLHSGDLKIEPLTDRGASGPCAFFVRDVKGWELVARETAIGVLES
jgi:hypothetical protein